VPSLNPVIEGSHALMRPFASRLNLYFGLGRRVRNDFRKNAARRQAHQDEEDEMNQNSHSESGNSPPRRSENSPPPSLPILRPNKKKKDPVASLVMNKRKLPVILRNDVPLLHLENTLVQDLVATRTKLWGVLHADVSKTINYDGQPAVILNVHESIRQIGPKAALDDSERNLKGCTAEELAELRRGTCIWLPRRITTKQGFKNVHIRRQFASGIRRVFSQPFWKGEPFPTHNLQGQPLEAIPCDVFVDVLGTVEENTRRFLLSIGSGRLLVRSSKETLLMSAATRLDNLKKHLHSLVATKEKELTENLTIEVLRRSQMGENRINAIYDVVFENRPLEEVSAHRKLTIVSLQRTHWRIQAEIRPDVLTQLSEWLKQNPEIAAAYEELENLKDVQVVIAQAKESAQNAR